MNNRALFTPTLTHIYTTLNSCVYRNNRNIGNMAACPCSCTVMCQSPYTCIGSSHNDPTTTPHEDCTTTVRGAYHVCTREAGSLRRVTDISRRAPPPPVWLCEDANATRREDMGLCERAKRACNTGGQKKTPRANAQGVGARPERVASPPPSRLVAHPLGCVV